MLGTMLGAGNFDQAKESSNVLIAPNLCLITEEHAMQGDPFLEIKSGLMPQ